MRDSRAYALLTSCAIVIALALPTAYDEVRDGLEGAWPAPAPVPLDSARLGRGGGARLQPREPVQAELADWELRARAALEAARRP